jgi:ornithine cyclodeaminase
MQLEALQLVRPIEEARVWARRPEAATEFARRMTAHLGIDVAPANSPSEAIDDADVLVTTTPATEPLLQASMLHPGLHATAIGSDAEHKQELAGDVFGAADVFAVDSRSQSVRLGELRAAVAMGFDPDDAVELGHIISGDHPGRIDDDQVTVCDLTGTGAQDTAIAGLAVQRCREAGIGTMFET